MSSYREMAEAPTDGTWVIGVDEHGREARIQMRQIHPKVPDVRRWFEGEEVTEGNWKRNVCFYPVGWREADDND
jgi:hypothetical protein